MRSYVLEIIKKNISYSQKKSEHKKMQMYCDSNHLMITFILVANSRTVGKNPNNFDKKKKYINFEL